MSILVEGLEIVGPMNPRYAEILSPEASRFLAELFRQFGARRVELLARRVERQREIDAGKLPDFLPATAAIRGGDWKVAPVPADLVDRRTEITGPVDRKMTINALNSGAQCWMADFEDANSPTWFNVIEGQINLREAINRTITYTSPEGKSYALKPKTATIVARPRGWHMEEKHVLFEGKRVSASLFDWGLYFFHNAKNLIARGSGPYFYLPKMESHLEARLWNDVFVHAQAALGIPRGTVRATILIETILGAFEAEEILYELREHASGLNCGRWDYMFSFVKKFRNRPEYLFPDRTLITMTVPFLRAYCLHVINVCHKHGAYAMGGMAAQIPIRDNPEANAAALAKVRADKLREATDGFDGTWVAHPGLVQTALDAFAEHMKGPNQLHRTHDVTVKAADLLAPLHGPITEGGVRWNIHVGIRYLEAWLGGSGAEPIHNLMEDLATSEISRSQLWQWLKYGAKLDDGRPITLELYERLLTDELAKIRAEYGAAVYDGGHFPAATELFMRMVKSTEFDEFLSLPAYELLPVTLAELNASDRAAFVAAIGHLFEHSPWVADETWPQRPFRDAAQLQAALCATMRGASAERKLALIQAHPDLAGRLAQQKQLTAESTREQASAGLDQLGDAELAKFQQLNTAYRARFGFPFIICARLNAREAILAAMQARIANTPAQEHETALGEIEKIAGLRLNDVLKT